MRLAAGLLVLALADDAVRVPAQMRLKDGTVYELQEPPFLKDGRYIFTTREGNVFSLADSEVAEVRLLGPKAPSKKAPNPQDSRELGAIARGQRRAKGKSALVSPPPTPRASSAP